MKNILDNYESPSDLKKMKITELNQLSDEIRTFILKSVSATGGHLSSNLGTVELTVALHYVFDSPNDQFLWDVGHQAYTHKILTGRMNQFDTLRKLDGLSGFLKRSESEHDIFEAGHSSTSISAGLGLSIANEKSGKKNYVLPIIGDGALSAGLAYEALNYAGQCKSQLIVILNDNDMSISNNVGSISKYLTKIRTLKSYAKTKQFMIKKLTQTNMGLKSYRLLSKAKSSIKELIIPGMLFEHFGLTYLGPVNGHDMKEMVKTFEIAKKMEMPVLIHVHTIKGKGYRRAELGPDLYHGVGTFDLEKGVKSSNKDTFSSVFGNHLLEMAKEDNKVLALTAAMPSGTGLSTFQKQLGEQFIDVGIAEQNAVTMAAGLAIGGYKPYVAIYSTFLQRAFDQIVHDVALQNLAVTFCIDRSGIVGRDGETHQGIFDTSFLTLIPNLTVMTPKDTVELKQMLDFSKTFEGPLAIKYFRENAYTINDNNQLSIFEPELIIKGDRTLLITAGRMVKTAVEASEELNNSVGVLNIKVIKPLQIEKIMEYVKNYKNFILIEENVPNGSITTLLENSLRKNGYNNILTMNLPDQFLEQGSVEELLERYHLDKKSMIENIKLLENG